MRVLFDPNLVTLKDLVQTGDGFSYFYGYLPYQRGWGGRQYGGGIGSTFRVLWKILKPYMITAGKVIGNEGLETGARILNNLAVGGDLKDTLKTQTKIGIKNLIKKTQNGSGIKKRKKRRKSFSIENKALAGRVVNKKASVKKVKYDALGLF